MHEVPQPRWFSTNTIAMDFKPMQIDIGRAASHSGGRRWYALSLRSRYEKKVHADLAGRGIESFLPLIEEVHVWSDRKKRVLEPLFRGYLFVRTDLGNRYMILETGGVVGFVGIRNRPSAIPDEQIGWVRIVAGHPARIKREAYLSNGDRVKVMNGPFNGIEGIVTKVKNSMRVVLSLDSIAQAVSVEVAPEFVVSVGGFSRSPVTLDG